MQGSFRPDPANHAMTLDILTLLVMIVITNLVMTVAVIEIARGSAVPGMRMIAVGMALNTATYLSFTLYGKLPPLASVMLGNTMGSSVIACVQLALVQLRGQRVAPPWLIVPPLAQVVISIALIDSIGQRLVVANAVFTIQQAMLLWTLVRPGPAGEGRGRRIMIATVAMLLVVFALRALSVALGWQPAQPINAASPLNMLTFIASYLGVVMLTFGFVLAAMESAAEQQRRLAMEDVLTGLPNRRAMMETLNHRCAEARRQSQPLTVLAIDIDHFKTVNDRYGHPGGDDVLRDFAAVIRQRLRAQDVAGRVGGEEFLVILPDTTPEGGMALAEALRATVAATPLRADGETVSVTISIGVHGAPAEATGIDPTDLIRRADSALYRAKQGGRDRVELG